MARRFKKQPELSFKTWGGRRERAGRPRIHDDDGAAHRGRPRLARRIPVHVTMRMRKGTVYLRQRPVFRAVSACLQRAQGRFDTAIVHFSVQGNHVHLIVESENERCLAAAMKGLAVRVAKALNKLMDRQGQVIDSRYHTHYLATPSEVRHAVRYVLKNHTKHTGNDGIDPYASLANPAQVRVPRTWLLQRHGVP